MQSIDQRTPFIGAALLASRAIASMAQVALSDVTDEVTLAQYRTLVVLAQQGPQNLVNLAGEIGVTPATATRMCDRLVGKKLITREPQDQDRRHIRLVLTTKGRHLVDAVTERRRREVSTLVGLVSSQDQATLSAAFIRFAAAVGKVPEQDWSAGWDL